MQKVAQGVTAPDSLRRLSVTTFAHDYAGTVWAHEASRGRPIPREGSQAALAGSAIALADDGPHGNGVVVIARHTLLDQIASDDPAQRDVALHHLAQSWGRAIYMDHCQNALRQASADACHAWIDLVTRPARIAMESYMASRLACRYVPGALPDHVSDAIHAISLLRTTIDAAKTHFREDNDGDRFLHHLHVPMMSVAVALGAFLGDATQRGSIDLPEPLRLSLEDLGLTRWWRVFADDLAARFADRGTWLRSDALQSLEAHIERIYVGVGVFLERADERMAFFLPSPGVRQHLT